MFRQIFVRNYMHGMWRLPSAPDLAGETFHEHDSGDEDAEGMQHGHSSAAPTQHVIYLYNKTKDDMAPGFRFETGRSDLSVTKFCSPHARAVAVTCGRTCAPCSMK